MHQRIGVFQLKKASMARILSFKIHLDWNRNAIYAGAERRKLYFRRWAHVAYQKWTGIRVGPRPMTELRAVYYGCAYERC
jgi:hypothetical protein